MDTVCHIITKLELGGAQQNTLFTVAHLDRTQFRPILITGESGLLDAEARVMEGVEFHQVPSLVRTINPMADLHALAALTALLKKLRPTIVHTHSSKAGIIGRLAAWMAGAPIIIHSIHGFGFTRYQLRLHRHVLLAAERVASRVTTRFFAVSEANRSQGMAMKLFSADQCRVIRSGVDLAAIRQICVDVKAKKRELGVDPEQPLVGMVAPMKPQKAPVDFIKMATAIHEKNPAVRFIFVGDGELRPAVEAEIKRCGLSELIRLLGWRRDVAEILRCLDVFVLTSLWEGLPRTYLEALASGVPVVGTRVNGAEEVIHNGVNGYLVEPGDVTRLAQRVLAVLEDPDQGRRMGHQGAARLTQEFDIWEMVRQQEHEYAHLIASLKFRRGSAPGTNTNAAGVEPRQIPIAKKAKYW